MYYMAKVGEILDTTEIGLLLFWDNSFRISYSNLQRDREWATGESPFPKSNVGKRVIWGDRIGI